MEEDLDFSQNSEIETTESTTLYKIASDAMEDYIEVYLGLSKQSNGFSNIQNLDLTSRNSRVIVIHGLSLELDPETSTSEEIKREAERILAVNFDIESAITAGVYSDADRGYVLTNDDERENNVLDCLILIGYKR